MANVEYFLSVYMQAPDITALTLMRHDHCAALWKRTGDTVALHRYWEFERITGFKHHRLPLRHEQDARSFLDTLLGEEGLTLDDMSAVWGTPHLATDNEFVKRQVPAGHTAHSVAHLFSAFGMDSRLLRSGRILGLAFDAGPDVQLDDASPETIYSGCVVVDGLIRFFPIESPATMWLLARGRFRREEGTLMALGSATTCTVDLDVESIVADLSFWTQADVFRSADLLIDAAATAVGSELSTADGRARAAYDVRFDLADNTQSAIMKLVERASAAVVDRTVRRAREQFGLDLSEMHLAICGGFALNCPNNSRMMDRYGFRGMLAPPCANDGGQALGIGLMALHDRSVVNPRTFVLGHAFHGRRIRDVDEALERFAPVVTRAGGWTFDDVVADLGRGPVAWVQGAAEIGPRALGHRSILGDPRRAATRDEINKIKQRQWWRPVAPIVLEDRLPDWFEADRRSPYMLEVFAGLPRSRDQIPAILHLDGTARVQTVSSADDATLFDLLSAFHRRTGVPILANTSLNDRGEPLVDSAAQALNFCIRKGLRVAYIDRLRVELDPRAAELMELAGPHPRLAAPFERDAARWADLWREWTDLGLSPQALFLYAWNPRMRDNVDPRSPSGARMLTIAATAFSEKGSDRERRFVAHQVNLIGPDSDVIDGQASEEFVGGG